MTDISSPSFKPALGVFSILTGSFALFFRNLIPMALIALIPSILGILINLFLISPSDQQAMMTTQDPDQLFALYADLAWRFGFSFIIGMILFGFGAAALTIAAYDAKMERGINIGRSLGAALKHMLIVAICCVLGGLGIYLGLILLIIPGLLLMAMWFVIVPAIVVDGSGFGAFGRSASLTKEYRWPLIGLLCLFFIAFWLIGMAMALVQLPLIMMGDGGFYVLLAFQGLATAFFYAIGGSMTALVYARLREIKEGTSFDELSEVFS
jgi:hypothetical protein